MAEDKPEENGEESNPDRPLECGECKKPIGIVYTEIVGGSVTRTSMCPDCPFLQKRLRGIPKEESNARREGVAPVGLTCGHCGTTLESLRVGLPMGCNLCYEVFDEALVSELFASDKIPQQIVPGKKLKFLHIGRAPGTHQEISSTSRLLALNEELNETLKREDYEQAALLRDQIKALTEKPQEEK